MSDDDLDIRHGGLVAVDTESLRAAADASSRLGASASASADRVQWSEGLLRESASAVPSEDAANNARFAVTLLRRVGEEAAALALSLRQAASLYEASELRVAWQMAGVGERDAIEAALRRAVAGTSMGFFASAHRDVLFGALDMRELVWRERAGAPLREDIADTFNMLDVGAPFGPGAAFGSMAGALLPGIIGATGLHLVRGPLQGKPDAVRVWALDTGAVRPPTSLAEVVGRMPGNENGRVRIERYDFPDGSREWLIYIAGTEGVGGIEPWDLLSDIELYAGRASASSAAVDRALALAGRMPDEPLHVIGYSQGGIIAAHKAAADPAVPTLITIATPVMPELGPNVFSVDLRHGDDPVAGLSAQGPAVGTGSPDSLVIRRTVPDDAHYRQLLDSHILSGYAETARQMDASDDPRVEAVRDVWAHLGGATAVTATNYAAVRVVPVKPPAPASSPAPHPSPAPSPSPSPSPSGAKSASGEKKSAAGGG